MEIVIDERFNGPPGSANGGYTCGVLAAQVGEPAQITLRSPPPLGRPLRFDGESLWDDDTHVAEARVLALGLEPRDPVSYEDAERASRAYPGFEQHAYPTCFVCGPARDDGLRLFTGPVGDGIYAAPWTPREVSHELAWASLDCPGAIGLGRDGRGDWLLGRMHGRVARLPEVGERCVVVSWPLGTEGRKGFAGTALYGEGGRLLGLAQQTWISPH